MSFLAGIKDLPLAIRGDGENLPGVAGGDVNGSVLVHGQVPNVLRLRIEEDRGLASGRHFVNFAVGRSAHEKIAGGIDRKGLGRQFRRFKHAGGFAARVDSQHFRVRAARRVQVALGIGPNLQEISEVGVGKFGEARRQKHFAVAAQCHAFRRPFVILFKSSLPPPAGVFGQRWRGNGQQCGGEKCQRARAGKSGGSCAALIAGV